MQCDSILWGTWQIELAMHRAMLRIYQFNCIYTTEVSLLSLSLSLALLHSRLTFIIWHEQKIPNFNHNLAPILPMRKGWAFEHRRRPNKQVTNINSTLSSLTTEVALLSLSLACFMRDWFSSFDVNGKFRISKLFD